MASTVKKMASLVYEREIGFGDTAAIYEFFLFQIAILGCPGGNY